MGPTEGERLAGPSKGVVSCWNHCPGAVASSDTSWVRRDRWRLQSVRGRRWIVMAAAAQVSGHIDAGLVAWQGEVGNGWSGGGGGGLSSCVTGAQLAAGAQDRVQVCTGGARLAGAGGGALQSQAQRQQQEPGALFLEQRQALRGRGQERGGDRGDWNVTEGEARREDACGDLGGSHWCGDPPRRAPVPRPEGLAA